MEAFVYGVEKLSTTKGRQFEVCLNRARQAATTWSDADRHKAIERLEYKIHLVTPAKCQVFDKLFQLHVRQLLQDVGTKTTAPRSKFPKELALIKASFEDQADWVATITADKQPQVWVRLSDAGTDAMTWRLADMEPVTYQREREIDGIISYEHKRFKTEFSIFLIKFEAWWETMGIQALRKTIQQLMINFGYLKRHLMRQILDSIH
jgi:hypothetical protein